jgi:hypothetical protein
VKNPTSNKNAHVVGRIVNTGKICQNMGRRGLLIDGVDRWRVLLIDGVDRWRGLLIDGVDRWRGLLIDGVDRWRVPLIYSTYN